MACRCNTLEFQMIIGQAGIYHLSFSALIHRNALLELAQIMPGAEVPWEKEEIGLIRKLVWRLLTPEAKKPVPDFTRNHFLKSGTAFQQKIWRLLGRIAPGETTTYGELARAAGSPGGARAVGQACKQNPLALIIPCHRVVAAKGFGGFAGSVAMKQELLAREKQFGDKPDLQPGDIECIPGLRLRRRTDTGNQ
jgi:O-6-methylguanine DNA methyltransferase